MRCTRGSTAITGAPDEPTKGRSAVTHFPSIISGGASSATAFEIEAPLETGALQVRFLDSRNAAQ
jgi:hypothetical protein